MQTETQTTIEEGGTMTSVPAQKDDTLSSSALDSCFIFGENSTDFFPWRPDSSFQPAKKVLFTDTLLTNSKGVKALNSFLKGNGANEKKQIEVIHMDGNPLGGNIQSHFWFTPCLFILFILYAFTLSSRKKMLSKESHNLLSPTSSGEMSANTPIEELQEHLPLILLGIANIAWLAFFCINTFSHTTESPSLSWILSLVAIAATLIFQLVATQAVCYVFFDHDTFHKLEKLKLLLYSLIGIVLIPNILILAYAPTPFIKPAIYVGIASIALLFLLYLFRALPFFFKGTLSIFYLILYLCTVEILPAVALIIGLGGII